MTLPMLPSGASLAFFRYSLALTRPLLMSRLTLSERTGFLVRCRMDGAEGWGEVAPLPGYSNESLSDVESILRAGIDKSIDRMPPSLRCGFDFAIRNCLAVASGSSLCAHLGMTGPAGLVRTAKLITDDMGQDQSPQPGQHAVVKLKVGRQSLSHDVERVNHMLEEAPAHIRFRLDVNRGWTRSEAGEFVRSIDLSRIEFIEEPMKDISDYAAFDQECDVPFAIDESLAHFSMRELDSFRNLAALVIKPLMLGSVEDCRKYLDWARTRQKTAVISSAYESGVGMRNLIALSAAMAGGCVAGLDTYSRLADDVATPRLSLRDGAYDATDSLTGAWQVDYSKLEEVA